MKTKLLHVRTDMEPIYDALIKEYQAHPESGIPEVATIKNIPSNKTHSWLIAGRSKRILVLKPGKDVADTVREAFEEPAAIYKIRKGKYADNMKDPQRLFLYRAVRIASKMLSVPCPQVMVRTVRTWAGYADCPRGNIYISYGTGHNETMEELLHTALHETRHIWQYNNGLVASEPNPKRDLEAYKRSWCETDAEAWAGKVLALAGINEEIELDWDARDRQQRIPISMEGIRQLKRLIREYRDMGKHLI